MPPTWAAPQALTSGLLTDGVIPPLALLPPNGAQRRTGMPLLVIRGAHFHLIALLSQASHMFLVRLGLDARRGRACLQGIRDEFKALVQKCADLRVSCGDQCDIGVLPLFCHAGLLVDREPWSLAIVDLLSSVSGVHKTSSLMIPCLVPILVTKTSRSPRSC